MKTAKRFVVWAALMLVMTFCVNASGTLVVKNIFGNTILPAMAGYAAKAENMLHPTPKEPDAKKKSNGLTKLVTRSLIDDFRSINKKNILLNFVFMYVYMDQSIIMFDKDGMSELSRGIFADVYEDTSGTGSFVEHLKNTVGLINVREFCELDNAEEVYDTLKKYPDAVLRLDSYSISNYLIRPAAITVLDGDGSEIRSFDFKCGGEIISAENIFIYDDNSVDGESENDYHGFCNEMTTAYMGVRRSDKIADELIDSIDFDNGDMSETKSVFGFGHYIAKSCEVSGDYAEICVLDFDFSSSVIMYIVIFSIPITLLTFLWGRKKKNEYY